MSITYDKLYPVLEGVCLAQADGKYMLSAKRIKNCIWRSKKYWLYKNEKMEEYFVRLIMTGGYRDPVFMRNCKNFGERSARILDLVREIMTEWED